MLGQLAMWGVGVPLLSYGLNRLLEGSPEDQMRKQYAMQQQLEQEHGGGMGMGGLVGGGPSPSELEALLMERERTSEAADAARAMMKLRSRKPRDIRELEDILGAGHARIAQMQSPRVLSALELIAQMEGIGG